MEKNCKKCIRFATCKFVEEQQNFAKTNKMFSMFEHLECNNLNELFYKNASSCKFYILDEIDVDFTKKKIEGAKWGFKWLRGYIYNIKLENWENTKKHAIDAIDKYIIDINKENK